MQRRIANWAPVALGLVLVAGIAASQQQAARMGLINLPVIMEQTPGYEEARATYQQEMQDFANELQAGEAELDSLMRDYERQQVVLTPTARQGREADLRQRQQQLVQRQQELQTQAQQRERELLAPLEQRVQAVVEGLRAERNLWVVFDVGNEFSGVVAADQGLDLTPQIVQRLRASDTPPSSQP